MTEREELIAKIKGLYSVHDEKVRKATEKGVLGKHHSMITPEIIKITNLFPDMERLKISMKDISPDYWDWSQNT